MSSIVRRTASKLLRLLERGSDPGAIANQVQTYSKDVAGVSQLFAQVSDGAVYPLTPRLGGTIPTWGNNSVAASADTRFLAPGSDMDSIADLTDHRWVAPRAGICRNLFVRHNLANGNGNSVVYTLFVNGIATALTATLATGAIGNASDVVNSVAIAQGDGLTLAATKALGLGSGVLEALVTVEIV